MSTRLHSHSPLPAPALRAGVPVQSKSHVLAGVQDAYWSDDEAEDAECPLCLEEMDVSDINFKPCPCGYQICRFCWHHIKENLNGRCPACRREYTDDAVQFKPVNTEDHKRLTQQKKQRDRERKDLETLNRRHLANVRVVQRNVVYVLGIGPRFAKEELIPTLRTNEYFGQYGKISKILIHKRTPPGGRAPVVGLYITYHRREDAARCIQAIDGASSPSGGNEIMRASHGTTKYCMAFLRSTTCTDHGCMNLHEWGDESDCFTKEDLTTLKHTMKDTETRTRMVTSKGDEEAGLPRAASWANKSLHSSTSTALHNHTNLSHVTHPLPSATRQTARRTATGISTRAGRSGSTAGALGDTKTPPTRERRSGPSTSTTTTTRPTTQSSSRPSTPATNRPVTPAGTKNTKSRDTPTHPPPSRSPTSSVAVESDVPEASPSTSPPEPPAPIVKQEPATSTATSAVSTPALPPGIPAVPPGLTSPLTSASPALSVPAAPPGLPPPRQLGAATQISVHPSQGTYQMSTQARALMEDLRARRESALTAPLGQSPFPDFDRMLQNLIGGDSGFSFNLDPKLAGDNVESRLTLPEIETEAQPFTGTYLDAFPGLRNQNPATPSFMPPPGLAYPARSSHGSGGPSSPVVERQSTGSSYTGSFNPFSENADEAPARRFSPLDEDRKMSRFGFARGRQGSSSSPLHTASPLSHHSESLNHTPFFGTPDLGFAQANTSWNVRPPHADYLHHHSASPMSSPLVQNAQAQVQQMNFGPSPQMPSQQVVPSGRFQPFDTGSVVSEAQLRDLINASRERVINTRPVPPDPQVYKYTTHQPFTDPAIMSAQLGPPMQAGLRDNGFVTPQNSMDNLAQQHQLNYGPPGLVYPPGIIPGPMMSGRQQGQPLSGGVSVGLGAGLNGMSLGGLDASQASGSAHVSNSTSPVLTSAVTTSSSPVLSSADFPALQVAASASTDSNNPFNSNSNSSSNNSNSNSNNDSHVRQQQQSFQPLQAGDGDVEGNAAEPTGLTTMTPEMEKERARAEKKAAKKAAAAERAVERQRVAAERAAVKAIEKERVAAEKAAEKERLAKEKAEQERLVMEKVAKEKAEKERLAKLEKEKTEKERVARENAEKEAAQAKAVAAAAAAATSSTSKGKHQTSKVEQVTPTTPKPNKGKNQGAKQVAPTPAASAPEPVTQAPILARMPKKNKPVTKPIKVPKEDIPDTQSTIASATTVEAPQLPDVRTVESSANNSRAHSMEPSDPVQLEEMFADLDLQFPWMHIPKHVFFDSSKINPAAKMPLEYGPLVHALSALSVGGGSFANNMPSGSIDNAVSSFQQLLETLTQTISDLLRLLPRTTWDDSSSFDGVLRDMLKGDDFLDDGGEDQNNHAKEDEVTVLTMALERRARWMEVQLSKLEELHRDINTAAVRAVLSFNDNGWDHDGFMPRVGDTLQRFDRMGYVDEDGNLRPMNGNELEKELVEAEKETRRAEVELREVMQLMQDVRPLDEDEW